MAIIKILSKKTPISKPKRKPGTRAGLTKAGIAADATKLIETVGPGEFSVRKLASAMGVGPTSIHAHFKGGTEAVLEAVAAQALAGTTRPFKPMEDPAEYLRELLLKMKMLLALHARPIVARLVVLRLSSNPILDPLLAERLLLTLTTLGVPAEALPKMFQRATGVILEMILTVAARSGAAEQKGLSARVHKSIATLSSTEFPNLTEWSRRGGGGNWVGVVSGLPNPSDSGVDGRNGDHAMTRDITKDGAAVGEALLFDDWFDTIEDGVRARVRGFIETMLEEELSGALSRPRYGRGQANPEGEPSAVVGVRHGHRKRGLTGTFGRTEISAPRARLAGADGRTREWKSATLRAYQRRTRAADALIAGVYLSGTNTRRVRRALAAVFAGPIGKDVVSRAWRKVKGDWDAWSARPLGEEPIVRLILGGTVVRVRIDRKATSISLLVALGVRADGQKVLLALRSMGGESEAAWRALLDDLVRRGLKSPELVVVDGSPGLEKALAALWPETPLQRCTVHKHRNLLAHAPERLHEELSNDYRDMIYAAARAEVETRRKAFIRKWRLKCRAVADSLEEAGDKLFTFTRFPPSQWKSIRTSNAIERLHEEFKRRIKTQTVLPCAETAAMLFWALLASGQITMRKVDGWQTLAEKPSDPIIDLAA